MGLPDLFRGIDAGSIYSPIMDSIPEIGNREPFVYFSPRTLITYLISLRIPERLPAGYLFKLL